MFGKMNIDKATRLFLTDPKITIAKEQLKPEVNFLAYNWNSYEKNIYTTFKRKHKFDLSIEQRWHITLAVFESCPYSIDFSLNDFLRGSAQQVAMWSVAGSRRFIDLGFPNNFPANDVLYALPFLPIFWYSISNFEVVYTKNEFALRFVKHMQEVDKLDSKEAIMSWYRRCLNFIDDSKN